MLHEKARCHTTNSSDCFSKVRVPSARIIFLIFLLRTTVFVFAFQICISWAVGLFVTKCVRWTPLTNRGGVGGVHLSQAMRATFSVFICRADAMSPRTASEANIRACKSSHV